MQNKNLQGIPPSDGFTHGHITWIGLGLALDIPRRMLPVIKIFIQLLGEK